MARESGVSHRIARLVLALSIGVVGGLSLVCFARRAEAKEASTTPDPMTLDVPGFSEAYYVRPRTHSRRPIILYLHGRGGNPFEDCRKWSRAARPLGWVVCP